MKKNNIKYNENISMIDRIAMIKSIVESCFTENEETGETLYTPYYRYFSELINFVSYFVMGVTFDDSESMYDAILADKEIMDLYEEYKQSKIRYEILNEANDIIEFKKLQIIHSEKSAFDNLLNSINELVTRIKDNLNLEEIKPLIQKLSTIEKLDEIDTMVKSNIITQVNNNKKTARTKKESSIKEKK